jgi:hypothetical protein
MEEIMSFDLKITGSDGRMEFTANISSEQRQFIVDYLMRSRMERTGDGRTGYAGPFRGQPSSIGSGGAGGGVPYGPGIMPGHLSGGGHHHTEEFIARPTFTLPGCLHDPDFHEAVQVRDDGTYVKCRHCGEYYKAIVTFIGGGGGCGYPGNYPCAGGGGGIGVGSSGGGVDDDTGNKPAT